MPWYSPGGSAERAIVLPNIIRVTKMLPKNFPLPRGQGCRVANRDAVQDGESIV